MFKTAKRNPPSASTVAAVVQQAQTAGDDDIVSELTSIVEPTDHRYGLASLGEGIGLGANDEADLFDMVVCQAEKRVVCDPAGNGTQACSAEKAESPPSCLVSTVYSAPACMRQCEPDAT